MPLQQALRHQHTAFQDLVVVDRWYPSSKTCATCGHLLATLSLGTRHWTCPHCGTRHDRDHNAAKNILAAGLAAHPPWGACLPSVTLSRAPSDGCR